MKPVYAFDVLLGYLARHLPLGGALMAALSIQLQRHSQPALALSPGCARGCNCPVHAHPTSRSIGHQRVGLHARAATRAKAERDAAKWERIKTQAEEIIAEIDAARREAAAEYLAARKAREPSRQLNLLEI
jgi:hypothetical protein